MTVVLRVWALALASLVLTFRECPSSDDDDSAQSAGNQSASRGGRRRRRPRQETPQTPVFPQPTQPAVVPQPVNNVPVQQPTNAGGRRLPFSDVDRVTEVNRTLDLIERGGPYPYDRDGVVFGNYEGLLPRRSRGYYHEYTVRTPGITHRGARRIINGNQSEFWYTDDHYRSFTVIDPRRY